MNEHKLLQVVMLGVGLDVMGGISSVEKLILEQGVPDTRLQHIATLQDVSIPGKIIVFIQTIYKFLWTLLRQKVDLVHIHFSSRGSTFRSLVLIIIATIFRKPLILHSHGSGFHIFWENQSSWSRQMIKFFLKKCNCLVVLSNSWKKFFVDNLDFDESKIVVMPNPVKIMSMTKSHDKEDPSIIKFIFLGRIGNRKGAFELIKAFSNMPEQFQQRAHLTMAGDGEVKEARNLVTELKLTDRVKVLDWLNSEKRDSLLLESDVFVLPSYNEGLPMAMIEAMSFGLSVITTPVGGIPELISHGENGLLVEPGNIQELSSTMQSLVNNGKLTKTLKIKAEASVAPLDIRKYCLSLMSVYQDALCSISK